MSLLTVENLQHSFGDNILFQNISFSLFEGEKMGLVGKNGAGKSTLLKILTDEIICEGGDIAWRPKISVGYLDQYLEIDSGQSIREYLQTAFARLYAAEAAYNEINESIAAEPDMKKIEQAAKLMELLLAEGFYELDTHIDRVASGLGVTALGMDSELAELSGGQRAKVILAKLLLENPSVLILDEPTNFLDESHIEWLTGFLNEFAGAFIVVSHHFDFLDRICNCIADIEFQALEKYKGNLTAYLAAKDMRRQQYIQNFAAQQKFIAKTEDYIARNKARASTARAAQSRMKMLAKVERIPPPKDNPRPHFRFVNSWMGNGLLLEVSGLSIGYDRPLLSPLDFKLGWGAKMAVTGFNGIGKSTLVKTLLGEIPALSGGFGFHERASIGYFQQEPTWEDANATPYSYIAALFPKLGKTEILSALARSGISGKHFFQSLPSLSGGEQAKVRICHLSLNKYNLLVLDEPTNHLDVVAKEVLQNALANYQGSLIVISHEKSFCAGFVNATLDVEKAAL